ncbi:hypothetical protein [Helicobacter sp. MIT 05-5293]|uniref:hypothetical protein n=1 Tax=Helicobacter sp. MIT 05-5293 TaxID=1548149 RepID=UPI000AAEE041|nr:hypothetical protein [Helicobacter sp. MIT 05-5293]
MKVKKEDLQDFFDQYKTFLEIEATVSFIKGRDYELIKLFYYLFLEISQGSLKVGIVKKMLDEKFRQYRDENKEYSSIQFVRGYEHIEPIAIALEKGKNISESFLLFTNAIKKYKEWRKKLSQNAIKEIYLKNLIEKQKYYFQQTPNKLNEYLLDTQCSTKNFILRQSLIEFHNAMSHVNAAYWCTSDNNTNIEKASNHFKRGALDSYKAIIKDFCILAGQSPIKVIEEELKRIRISEYQTIGDDARRNQTNLYRLYDALTSRIIESIKA